MKQRWMEVEMILQEAGVHERPEQLTSNFDYRHEFWMNIYRPEDYAKGKEQTLFAFSTKEEAERIQGRIRSIKLIEVINETINQPQLGLEFWVNIYSPENEVIPGGLRNAYLTKEDADQFATGRVKCIKVREVKE